MNLHLTVHRPRRRPPHDRDDAAERATLRSRLAFAFGLHGDDDPHPMPTSVMAVAAPPRRTHLLPARPARILHGPVRRRGPQPASAAGLEPVAFTPTPKELTVLRAAAALATGPLPDTDSTMTMPRITDLDPDAPYQERLALSAASSDALAARAHQSVTDVTNFHMEQVEAAIAAFEALYYRQFPLPPAPVPDYPPFATGRRRAAADQLFGPALVALPAATARHALNGGTR